MIRRLALALWLVLLAHYAWADAATQRLVPGMSLSLQGELLDLNAPVCTPAAGSYSVQYRNSIATGCLGRGSDDFATLVFSGGSAATYTMPKSSVTTFTGSISGTTLTTPSNAVVIGSVITDPGSGKVLDNTYVVSGSGTTWTINQSQTVASETLTQSVFPPGHGVCVFNAGTAVLSFAATTSTVYGAPGFVSGSIIPLLPNGSLCSQADPSNNYLVENYNPGIWRQTINNTSPNLQWTGLSGFNNYELVCEGVYPAAATNIYFQVGEGSSPTWEASNYYWVLSYQNSSSTGPLTTTNASDSGIQFTGNTVAAGSQTNVYFDAKIYSTNGNPWWSNVTWILQSQGYAINGAGQYQGDTNVITAMRLTTANATNLDFGTCALTGLYK